MRRVIMCLFMCAAHRFEGVNNIPYLPGTSRCDTVVDGVVVCMGVATYE